MMPPPKVSFLMSVYGESLDWVKMAVDGVLSQSFTDWEAVIISDGVRDAQVLNYLKGLNCGDSRFKIFYRENQGLTKSLNFGISQCRGEFIARQDADDWSLPRRVELQLSYFKSHPELAMLGTECVYVNSRGEELGIPKFVFGPENVLAFFRNGNPFAHGSVMVRRKAFIDVGGYDERLLAAQDYDCFYRICSRFSGDNLRKALYVIRYSNLSISANMAEVQIRANYEIRGRICRQNIDLKREAHKFQVLAVCRKADLTMLGGDTARALSLLLGAIFRLGFNALLFGKILRATVVLLYPPALISFFGFRKSLDNGL